MKRDDKKQKNSPGKIIGIVVALAAINPLFLVLLLLLGLPVGIGWLALRGQRKQNTAAENHSYNTRENTTYLKECSVPLRLHRDRGVHHVRRGRGQDPWDNLEPEIDPWDRPDIDIRKYQRR